MCIHHGLDHLVVSSLVSMCAGKHCFSDAQSIDIDVFEYRINEVFDCTNQIQYRYWSVFILQSSETTALKPSVWKWGKFETPGLTLIGTIVMSSHFIQCDFNLSHKFHNMTHNSPIPIITFQNNPGKIHDKIWNNFFESQFLQLFQIKSQN